MGETYRVEIELGENWSSALETEAARLGLGASDLATRAVVAWLADMRESAVTTTTEVATAT